MLVPIKWLNSFVDTQNIPFNELVDKISECGNEVDSVAEYPCQGVVTALVESKEKHPNADTLAVCVVFDGSERHNVVCGAPNVDAGQIIAFAPIGAKLPEMVLRKVKIRGIESQGMICSKGELGFPVTDESEDGIWVLGTQHQGTQHQGTQHQGAQHQDAQHQGTQHQDAQHQGTQHQDAQHQGARGNSNTVETIPLGLDVAEMYGIGGAVLDIGLTPNRGDCLSIRGMAREVHAIFGVPMVHAYNNLIATMAEASHSVSSGVPAYTVEDGAAERYLLAKVTGVSVGESSALVQARLHGCGIRPINSIVDTTNYVMMELGQPMHAFDADHIEGGITVRLSGEGEQVVTLDGAERNVPTGVPVIADAKGIIAIAGVMGGLRGSVSATTTNILLESAVFPPNLVRRSAKVLGLSTDSSHRFERGIDLSTTDVALRYAIALLSTNGTEYAYCNHTGQEFTLPPKPVIRFDENFIPALLGADDITHDRITANLEKLGYGVERENGQYAVTVPYHRMETARYSADIAEEVVRMYGINNLPNKLPKLFAKATALPKGFQDRRNISSALIHQGFFEVITYPFIKKGTVALFAEKDGNEPEPLTLRNPISEDMKVMRTTMVSNLVTTFVNNFNQGVRWGKLFEFGSVYTRKDSSTADSSTVQNNTNANNGEGMQVDEEPRLGLLSYGDEHFASYPFTNKDTKAEVQFFVLKGVVTRVFATLGADVEFNTTNTPKFLHPGRACNVILKGKFQGGKEGVVVGTIGELHPSVAKECDAPHGVVVAEMYTHLATSLMKKRVSKFKSFLRTPDIRKDIAVAVDETTHFGDLAQTITKVKLGNGLKVVDVYLIDEYRDKKMLEGKRSITIRIMLNAGESTPTDAHLSEGMDRVVQALADNNDAVLRQ